LGRGIQYTFYGKPTNFAYVTVTFNLHLIRHSLVVKTDVPRPRPRPAPSRPRPRPRPPKTGLERSRDQDRGLEEYKTDKASDYIGPLTLNLPWGPSIYLGHGVQYKFIGKLIPNVQSTDLNKASDYIGP